MDVDYQPLPKIWKDTSPPTTPGPAASSSKTVAPTSAKKSRRGIPHVIIPPRPQPVSPVVPAAPTKKGKPAAKAKGSDVIKNIPVLPVPEAEPLDVPEVKNLRGSIDLAAVSDSLLSLPFLTLIPFYS